MSRAVGTRAWIPTERFPVEQRSKVRGCDNAQTGSEINSACCAVEKLTVPSTNQNLTLVRELKKRCPQLELASWVLDESNAYRQVPVAAQHRRFAVIVLWDTCLNRLSFLVMTGHSYGLLAAVFNFNRRSAVINDIFEATGVLARTYYDDHFGFTTASLVQRELQMTSEILDLLGVEYGADKRQPGTEVDILGISYRFPANCLAIQARRRQHILEDLETTLRADSLEPAAAAKLKGRLGFVCDHFWGRYGRACLLAHFGAAVLSYGAALQLDGSASGSASVLELAFEARRPCQNAGRARRCTG